MRATLTLLSIFFYALSSGTTSGDDRKWLLSLVELVELDYEDHCEQRANATWNELIRSNAFSEKLDRDKAFGIFSQQQMIEVKSALTAHALMQDDDVLRRKVKLLLQPGDTLLNTEQWIKLVTFGDTALYKLRFASNYDCGSNVNCTLKEFQSAFARQQDENNLIRMKQSWEKKLPDLEEYLQQILPLARTASKENNYNSVEQYWDSLVEYEGATMKAREIWDQIQPLYVKLHKYVTMKLKGPDAAGKTLPVHLLRSLTGEDWSNIIESLLPKHSDVYQKVHTNLQLKGLGGYHAFAEASKLIDKLELGDSISEVVSQSIFDGSCPTILVDWCKPNRVKAVSCKDVTIANYLDAHETVMSIKYKEVAAIHSNNSYIFREAPRYSAIYEAIPGFASLLAITPHALDSAGLYSLKRFSYNPNHHRLVLQLLIALRDLPRLNYYLAADEWRLKVLMGTIPPSQASHSWSEFRKNFSMIETSDVDFLSDPYILLNKPFTGKFMGLILKYQVYQSFAEEMISDDSDLIKHVEENSDRLMNTMIQGYAVEWPELISDLLAKRENGLEYTALTDYYRFLDEYLDNQLDPSVETSESDDYVEPEEDVKVEDNAVEQNEILDNPKETHSDLKEPDTHLNILDNVINTGDDTVSKFGSESSTEAVMEVKNPVAIGNQNSDSTPKEASYNTYWWIGIIVALAIVVIVIAIVAKKRSNHRKELERHRRGNTSA